MVTFVCYNCDATLKKAQLEKHSYQCRPTRFICIDCSQTFEGNDYKTHTDCMTEEQKYFGQYAKKTKQQLHLERMEKSKAVAEERAKAEAEAKAKKAEAKAKKLQEEAEAEEAADQQEGEGEEESTSTPWPGWKKSIRKVLKQKKTKAMKLRKLKQLVCEEYISCFPSANQQETETLFDEKLATNSKTQIIQEPYVTFA